MLSRLRRPKLGRIGMRAKQFVGKLLPYTAGLNGERIITRVQRLTEFGLIDSNSKLEMFTVGIFS